MNRPLNQLGLYQQIDPIVTLPDGRQFPWKLVRDGKIPPLPTPEQRKQGLNRDFLKILQDNALKQCKPSL